MKNYKSILMLTGLIYFSFKNKNKNQNQNQNYELIYNNNNTKIKNIINNIELNHNYFNFSNNKLQIIDYVKYEFSFFVANYFNKCYLCDIKNTYEINVDKNTNIYFEIFSDIPNNDKIIVLNHGITDTTASLLLKKIEYYNKEGYDICIFWRRGHYNNITNNLIVSDSSEDLDKAIVRLVDEKKYKQIFLDGVSAGTITVYKYLVGNYEYKKYVKGAILKGPSFNILKDLNQLDKFYSDYIRNQLIYLINRIENHNYNIDENMSLVDILVNITTVNKGYDKNYVLNNNDFNIDFNLYKNNKIPLLILTSEDDPITKYDNIGNLKEIVSNSNNMILLITKTGHHTLWLSKDENKDSLSELIVKFIKNLE